MFLARTKANIYPDGRTPEHFIKFKALWNRCVADLLLRYRQLGEIDLYHARRLALGPSTCRSDQIRIHPSFSAYAASSVAHSCASHAGTTGPRLPRRSRAHLHRGERAAADSGGAHAAQRALPGGYAPPASPLAPVLQSLLSSLLPPLLSPLSYPLSSLLLHLSYHPSSHLLRSLSLPGLADGDARRPIVGKGRELAAAARRARLHAV